MERLKNPIRGYVWGSDTAIAALCGRDIPAPGPEAELWMGAHPGDPSLVGAQSLAAMIEEDPEGLLGPALAAQGSRLPFLMKLLAADQPLSLQAHPDSWQAQQGFAAGNVNYVDPYHKPELLVALSDFEGLCGFRAPVASASLLASLGVPALDEVVAALEGPDDAEALRTAVSTLLTWPAEGRSALVESVAAACAAAGPVGASDHGAGERGPFGMVGELARRYPGDVGVVVALLLNHVWLRPGEAVYMPAGYLHAYCRGVGIEIMAASDNVLRGGLTPKRVDVPELLRVLRFTAGPPPVVLPEVVAPGVVSWPTQAPDFTLRLASVGGPHSEIILPAAADGPRILFCTSGRVLASDGSDPLQLGAGDAVFIPANRTAVTLTGFGQVYQATVS